MFGVPTTSGGEGDRGQGLYCTKCLGLHHLCGAKGARKTRPESEAPRLLKASSGPMEAQGEQGEQGTQV